MGVPLVPLDGDLGGDGTDGSLVGAGWLEWLEDPGAGRVRVRVAERDGRFHVVDLHVSGELSAQRLRSVPLGRIEAAANALLHGGRATPPVPAAIDPALRRGAGRGYGEGFYVAVAEAYQTLSHGTSRPVALLAEANEVPVTTAQRWVREARLRGLLPPGRPGKAG